MSAIQGTFFRQAADGDAVATNGATAKLWVDATLSSALGAGYPPQKGTAVPSSGQSATVTTGVAYGGIGAFRFTGIASGTWWVSVEYGTDDPIWEVYSTSPDLTGAIDVGGAFSVATNKFNIASATGNTTIAGTLGVTGATTLSGTLSAAGAVGFGASYNKFTVAAATGNTAIAGTLAVTGATTLSSTLNVTGVTTLGTANVTLLKLGGVSVTSTAAELNILDGVTATAAEINKVCNNVLSGLATWEPGAITASASVSKDITVTGAVVGDYVQTSSTRTSYSGMIVKAYVSAPGTVTIYITNWSAGTVTLSGTHTYYALVTPQ